MSKFGKFYQNTTSYYNGYFNADEIYQLSLDRLQSTYKDDYQKILSIYPYQDLENVSMVNQDMDKVIEKLGRVINLHRAANWVDDSYLLMGKAQFVKKDYEKAQQTFEYFHDEMNPAFKKAKTAKKSLVDKKSKKEKKKKSSKKSKKRVLKRDMVKKEVTVDSNNIVKTKEVVVNTHVIGTKKDWLTYNEGLLWLAKTYIERDKLAGAFYLMNRLTSEPLNKDLNKELNLLKAYYYLKQKKYSEATSPLSNAISFTSSNKEKARYSFILGQIYEKLNNREAAYKMFNNVAEMKPDYDLEFNAILKLLKNYNGNSTEYANTELEKLLKEEKYFEYHDIIYFTMAETQFGNNDIDGALVNYNTSLRKNFNNNALKTECYYKLANISFDKENFVMSKKYYDSTLMNIQQKDERYLEVKNLSENLKDIAKNLEIITLQDSLINISRMSEDDRRELALNIRKKQIEEEENQRKAQEQGTKTNKPFAREGDQFLMTDNVKGRVGLNTVQSSFFAYNIVAKETGKQEFTKTWGLIRLEDDWRRSNKISNSFDEISSSENDVFELSDEEIKKIFADVPNSPGQISDAELKIQHAMMNLGMLYRDKLQNYDKSVEILERLINKYPEFEDACKANYYLQLSYKNLNQFNKADLVVSEMSENYPDCIYTKILTIPNFAKNINSIEDKKAEYYENIVLAYKNDDYSIVKSKIDNAPVELSSDPKYAIKLDLLKAKMIGKSEGKEDYILALEDFLEKYPASDEAVNIRETLRFLKGDQNAFSTLIYKEEHDEFSYDPDKMHYIIIIVQNTDPGSVDKIKSKISEFNDKFFKLDRLKLSNIYFDTKGTDQIILLRKFDTAEQAMKYYNDVEKNKSEFIDKQFIYDIFAVSQKNYREIIKQKSVESYNRFFSKTYLKKED